MLRARGVEWTDADLPAQTGGDLPIVDDVGERAVQEGGARRRELRGVVAARGDECEYHDGERRAS